MLLLVPLAAIQAKGCSGALFLVLSNLLISLDNLRGLTKRIKLDEKNIPTAHHEGEMNE